MDNTHDIYPAAGPIGVFDSGYGGLTILQELRFHLPQYDYLYLGDNARAPYGNRSFELVYKFTLESVKALFARGCHLVILACNTASAKALRTIQQNDLPNIDPSRRVLGIIRPTVEHLATLTRSGHVGILGTKGTVASRSYEMEAAKLSPDLTVTGHACPMWVPLVENGEAWSDGADYFVEKDISQLMAADPLIDRVILGCTHYPLLLDKICRHLPDGVGAVTQGTIVAESLADYLRRHPEIECRLSKGAGATFLTTEQSEKFTDMASLFLGQPVKARHIEL
ncbi:MAG: glutamate racemase [Muribaculaceae bacterium]|nr:glutamate racemase [Muribaculaceae bacterium]